MKFPYLPEILINPITKEKDIVYRPFIPINIAHNGNWLSVVSGGFLKAVNALVDSGADHNVAPMDIAKMLKISFEGVTPYKVHGIDGIGIDTFFVPISIAIGGQVFETFMGFAREVKEVLLGGQGFFNQWKVKLEYAKDIEIMPMPSTALKFFHH